MAHGDARGALCRRFPRYPFSPLTFNAFPERDWSAPSLPVASLAATNFAKHRDINRLITRMALGVDIYTMRESTAGRWSRVRGCGKREREKRGWVSWKFGDTPGVPTTRRYQVRTPAPAGASRRSADRTCRMTQPISLIAKTTTTEHRPWYPHRTF